MMISRKLFHVLPSTGGGIRCCWRSLRTTSVILRSSVTSETSDVTQNAKPFSEIPGPKGLPYFGTLLMYKSGQINVFKLPETLKRWHRQYGGIVKETLAGHTVVHMFDPEFIRLVYANEDKWPRIEPLLETTQLYRQQSNMSPGLGNTNDEEWYRLRSAVQQLMMRPKEVVPFLPGVDQVALDFVSHLKQLRNADNEVPNFAVELARWSLESSGISCFDTRLGFLTEKGKAEAQELIEASSTVFKLTTKLKFSLPLYKFLPTPSWKKLVAAEDVLYSGTQRHLEEALARLRQKTDNGELREKDFRFLQYLLSREDLSLSDVSTLTLSLFTDGQSTTTPTLLFTLYLLASNPSVQDKAVEEIQSLIPRSAPLTGEMVNQMSYLRACIKESVRMFPINNEISRIAKKDMVVGGYHIPAGTSIHLNNTVLFRNPTYFEEPEKYIPDRWLRDGSAQKVHPFIVLPFGHGPRMCAGRRFAEQDMAVLLTRILQNFRLEWKHSPMGLKYLTLNVPDCPAQYTFYDR
ncbi:hypothetical protein BaRGS_00005279 [Batillaria attramentaria]|uniref:Cytochrome P450 n=1 Tax=Batillaria attramentaria TaxID=370345 RepID=A0ABD0LW68_9CAEN